jgi:hypothetical protein
VNLSCLSSADSFEFEMIVGSVFAEPISSRALEQNSLATINIRAFIAIKHFAAKINS